MEKVISSAYHNRDYDLVIENVVIANVYTKELLSGKIAIKDGIIAHVSFSNDEELPAKQRFNGGGRIAAPGFIDTHMHIESGMMTTAELSNTILPRGTTTIVADPHEFGNVSGIDGIRYLIESSRNLPLNIYFMAPSCVPSAEGVETPGATLGPDEVAKILSMERVIGLAEVMDYPGIIEGKPRISAIAKTARDRGALMQGHAPLLSGSHLSAYLVAGARSDHEVTGSIEAKEKLRLGMTVEIRESSVAKNMAAIAPAVIELGFPENCTLSTDDREADDLLKEGHLDHVARRAVEEGIPAMEALKMMTLNAAKWLRFYDRGAISPGLRADIVLLDDFDRFQVGDVFSGGKLVASKGEICSPAAAAAFPYEAINTMFLKKPVASDFSFGTAGLVSMPVMRIDDNITILTHLDQEDILLDENGFPDLSERADLALLSVFERHGKSGTRGLCLVKNSGVKEGAIASTVAHDCHNLVVIGRSVPDMVMAAGILCESGGGIVCANRGNPGTFLPLPIGGIMSNRPAKEISETMEKLKENIRALGLRGSPILQISSLSLAVIPHVRLTDLGLVDVISQTIIPVP